MLWIKLCGFFFFFFFNYLSLVKLSQGRIRVRDLYNKVGNSSWRGLNRKTRKSSPSLSPPPPPPPPYKTYIHLKTSDMIYNDVILGLHYFKFPIFNSRSSSSCYLYHRHSRKCPIPIVFPSLNPVIMNTLIFILFLNTLIFILFLNTLIFILFLNTLIFILFTLSGPTSIVCIAAEMLFFLSYILGNEK